MLIGNQYADNRMYRGINYYDRMPMTSEDIHEGSDTQYMKNAYIMNNLLGYGTLNDPSPVISESGISLSAPSVVMIDGDVSLVQSDEGVPFISTEALDSAGYSEGTICILGWYQHLNASSVMKNYGGVDNSTIPNNLYHEGLGLQVSSRHQFRWYPVILSRAATSADSISLTVNKRDKNGVILISKLSLTSKDKFNDVFIFDKPEDMDYAESDLYLVPIVTYSMDNGSLTRVDASDRLRVVSESFYKSPEMPENKIALGSVWYNTSTREFKTYLGEEEGFVKDRPLIKSDSEPEGLFPEGTVWYSPITGKFRTYVNNRFIANSSTMAFLQYQSSYSMPSSKVTPQDVVVPINISELAEGDILTVTYENLLLTIGENYTVNYADKTITLLGFTTNKGDIVHFSAVKIVEANDITNITEVFTTHMSTTGSSTVEGHLKLTDTISTSNATKGIAATPKLVNDVKKDLETKITNSSILTDENTNKKYKLVVRDGVLSVEEL